MDLAAKIKDVLNVETIKLELIKTAFGKPDVYFAKIDPRVLIFWYLTISILPWFTFNNTILITIILYTAFLAVSFKSKSINSYFTCHWSRHRVNYNIYRISFLWWRIFGRRSTNSHIIDENIYYVDCECFCFC